MIIIVYFYHLAGSFPAELLYVWLVLLFFPMFIWFALLKMYLIGETPGTGSASASEDNGMTAAFFTFQRIKAFERLIKNRHNSTSGTGTKVCQVSSPRNKGKMSVILTCPYISTTAFLFICFILNVVWQWCLIPDRADKNEEILLQKAMDHFRDQGSWETFCQSHQEREAGHPAGMPSLQDMFRSYFAKSNRTKY